MGYLDKLQPVGTVSPQAQQMNAPAVPGYARKLSPVTAQVEESGGGFGGFIKSLISAPATIIARPFQAGAELLGASAEQVNRVTRRIAGDLVAPVPESFADVKKDIGRGIQTVAFGAAGPVSAGIGLGVGGALEQGEDLFSAQTAFQAVLGGAGGKVLGLIGKPLLNTAGKVVGKITPKVIKDVASKGAQSIQQFAATHKILPEGASLALTRGAQRAETIANKPFQVAGDFAKRPFVKAPENIVSGREQEIFNIETNYSAGRKKMKFSRDAGSSSRRRIAETDVLVGAVDENGLIRTTQKGGAVEQYKNVRLQGTENLGRRMLEKEGASVTLKDVERELIREVSKARLEGADLQSALRRIKSEIAGYKIRVGRSGKIRLDIVHDAKISTTNGINYQTPPEVKAYRKAIAKALRNIIEKNSKTNIGEVNAELAKYLDDIERLELLDGKKVKGGKLGKYFAQITGGLAGGMVGGAIGGPGGFAAGAVTAGELAGKLKGTAFQRSFGKKANLKIPQSDVLRKATQSLQ